MDTTSSHLFYMYGQLQPGPGLSSERPDAVHTLSLPRLLEQNWWLKKGRIWKWRRDCARSFTVSAHWEQRFFQPVAFQTYSKTNLLQGHSFHSTLCLYLPAWFLSLGGVVRNCRTFLLTSLQPPKVWFHPVQSTAAEAEKIGIPVEDSKNCENHLSSHAKVFSAKRYL